MAYKINRTTEYVVPPQGLASTADVHKLRSEMAKTTPEFYELEPAEVIDVFLDEDDFRYHDHKFHNTKPVVTEDDKIIWKYYGWIRARMAISNKGENNTILVAPLDSNIKEYPYPGEHVIVASYYGKKYYTQKLNTANSVNLNSFKGLSRPWDPWGSEDYNIKEFKGNFGIRQLQAYEGDITFNGRFGQSIRFGSNITELYDKNEDLIPDSGKPQSPNLIIRAGQGIIPNELYKPVKEDINLDSNSMWMTTDQLVPLTHEKSQVTNLDPKFITDSSGNQIILNSDRLVFNSKGTDTFLYSTRDINLVSKNRIVLEGHENVYLGTAPEQGKTTGFPSGDVPRIQPVLKGDQTMDLIEKLINYLIEFSITMQSAKGSVVDFVVPVSGIKEGCMGLEGALRELKTRLNDPKSNIVKTG